MKVVFFGYHDVGCACLGALLDAGADVALVVTHEDDPGENVWFGSVAEIARSRGIPVITPTDANAPDVVERVRALAPGVILSAYYRRILGSELLGAASVGAFNMHGSLLPKFRGRAPVNWVLVKGETETGVTLHHMAEKPDRGDIVGQTRIPIEDTDTAFTLHRKSAAAAGALLADLWPRIVDGTAPRIRQDPALASYYGRRRPEDGRIDWSRSAREIWNLVRAVTHPYPGAFAESGGTKLFLWKVAVMTSMDGLAMAVGTAPGAPGQPSGSPGSGTGRAQPRAFGTILGVLPGRGFVVSTAQGGGLLVESAQVEGQDEKPAEDLIRLGALRVGQRFD